MLALGLALTWTSLVVATDRSFLPQKVFIGPGLGAGQDVDFPVVLNGTGQDLTLDYGYEVAGTPYFKIEAIDRPIQIELKYSEEYAGLQNPLGDGPYPFSQGLSATFRTETFNITSAGTMKSFFIQGGQRWQRVTQLTEGLLTIAEVGFIPSFELTDHARQSGQFECSNAAYNQIWKLGALASSAACLEAGSQSPTWELTPEGALVRGQRPALSAKGLNFANYTLHFRSKIIRGGTGWAYAQPDGVAGLQMLLMSELPEATRFANTNTSLTPSNSLVLTYGFSLVNQTTLPSRYLETFKIPFTVKEGIWYDIHTRLFSDAKFFVSINGTPIFNVSLSDFGIVLSNVRNPAYIPGTGTWGFGPWQDQIAVYTDVTVTSPNGTVLYQDALTSEDVSAEYGVAANNATVCLDGPKRDRLVWLGDAFHTTRIIPASNVRRDHVLGTFQYLQEWQNEQGLLPIAPPMGYNSIYASLFGGYGGLLDYQTLGLLAFTGYFHATGDVDFVKQLWPGFEKQLAWLTAQINSTTGLAEIGGFTGPPSGTATSAQLAQALHEVAFVATAVGLPDAAANYTRLAAGLKDAIEAKLWNEALGVYATSLSTPSNFSVADIAFAITSGLAARNATRQAMLIKALDQLALGPGYKDSSGVSAADPSVNISPNTNGFLLSALMHSNATAQGKFLFDHLWTAMIANDSTATGASWEYVNAHDLSPGLGLFTSLSHPWGGAPTYVMPQWIAGLRPVTPGYKTFIVSPAITGFDVTHARAKVPTAYGDFTVAWQVIGNVLHAELFAPTGTSGSFVLPGGAQLGSWSINTKAGAGGTSIPLSAGNSTIVVQL